MPHLLHLCVWLHKFLPSVLRLLHQQIYTKSFISNRCVSLSSWAAPGTRLISAHIHICLSQSQREPFSAEISSECAMKSVFIAIYNIHSSVCDWCCPQKLFMALPHATLKKDMNILYNNPLHCFNWVTLAWWIRLHCIKMTLTWISLYLNKNTAEYLRTSWFDEQHDYKVQ